MQRTGLWYEEGRLKRCICTNSAGLAFHDEEEVWDRQGGRKALWLRLFFSLEGSGLLFAFCFFVIACDTRQGKEASMGPVEILLLARLFDFEFDD